MSASLLLLGLIFGSIGTGYYIYGRRQSALVPFLCGVLLIGVPYFIDNGAALVTTGVVLALVPYFARVQAMEPAPRCRRYGSPHQPLQVAELQR